MLGVIGGALITGLSLRRCIRSPWRGFRSASASPPAALARSCFAGSGGTGRFSVDVGVISHATGSLRAGLLLPLAATVILFVIHLFDW